MCTYNITDISGVSQVQIAMQPTILANN